MNNMHKVVVSNNVTNFSLVGGDDRTNAAKSAVLSINLGSRCASLAPSAFAGCQNLQTAIMPTGCIDLGEHAFAGCRKLKQANCIGPVGYKLASIGDHCFDGCDSLSSVYFSLGAPVSRNVNIGKYSFANCANLETVIWRDWAYMGSYMFAGCPKLKSLNLTNNTNYVQEYAFAGIPNIEKIDIPNKVWFVSDGMFQDCSSLTSVNIQDTDENRSVLGTIGASAFSGCSSLTSITIPRSIAAISCLDTQMLVGSNIQKVYCNGMDDSVFGASYSEMYDVATDGYITSYVDWKIIEQMAISNHTPVIVMTSHSSIDNVNQGGCGMCRSLVNALKSAEWKQFTALNADKVYFVYASYDDQYKLWDNIKRQYNMTHPFNEYVSVQSDSRYYAGFWIAQVKTDGSILHNMLNYYNIEKSIDICESIISSSAGQTTAILNSNISKLGSPLSAVTFVSKQGHEYVVSSDTQIEYKPEVRVDAETYVDFKYGTWYYNAEQLRAFADEYHIPVFVEYSKDGCRPCVFFRKNVYNNQDFQNWVSKSPYLFCRIELQPGERFDDRKRWPQAYYVDQVWAKEKYGENPGYIPIMFWYWNKEDGTKVFDLSSYHFNPGVEGETPPFSMRELMNMTDSKFSGYERDDAFAKYETSVLYSNKGATIGRWGENIYGDETGVAFPAQYKQATDYYQKTFDISGYDIVNSLSVGQEVEYSPATYYLYDTVMSQSYHIDRYGVIFRTDLSGEGTSAVNVVSWIQQTQNVYENDKKEQEYECGKWYDLSSSDDECELFDSIVKESENMDYHLIILKTTSGNAECDRFIREVKQSDAMNVFVKLRQNVYFVHILADGFSFGIGARLKDFYMKDFRQSNSQLARFGKWTDSVPSMIVYQGCSSCSSDLNRPAVDVASDIDVAGKTVEQTIEALAAILP